MTGNGGTAGRAAIASMSEDHRFVVDGAGNQFDQRDPRVVHIFPYRTNDYLVPMFARIFERRGLAFRGGDMVTPETLQGARNLCSGRECLSFTAIAAATHRDLTKRRGSDEISIYYGLEQEGPCQIGAWPLVWEVVARRMGIEGAVFPGHATIRNNYMGHGMGFGTELMSAIAASDVLDEARGTLPCVAADPERALEAFEEEARVVVESARGGLLGIARALARWSHNVRKIPRNATVEEVPRVLVFGGGALSLVHRPIVGFLSEQGIAAKVVDFSEFILYLESEWMMRFGFATGRHTPASLFEWSHILAGALAPGRTGREARRALRSRLVVQGGEWIVRRFKTIARASGLTYDEPVRFLDLIQRGDAHIPYATYCEAIVAVGRFEAAATTGVYDGFVHVATVNCQPSVDAQTVIRKLASEREVTLAALDVEVPRLTPNQMRLLENVVVQAKRRRTPAVAR
jgi:predicted nucleotide-binding protein (sugar kinase/HSP70/actin superfamily)